MKNLLLITSFLLSFQGFAEINADTLKNVTIIKMTTSKLGDNLILSKIKTSPVNFDISPDALIALKKAAVSDVVIEQMVEKQTLLDETNETNLKNNSSNGKYTFQKSGIYFVREGEKYTKLDPTLINSAYNFGFYSPKYTFSIDGISANYNLKKESEIYFNFVQSKKDLNSTNNSGSVSNDYMDAIMNQIVGSNIAISPNEFKLVKLRTKRNKREYYAKANIAGQASSIKGRCIVNFKYEQVSENTYKVILPADILPGQYCFVYQSKNPMSIVSGQVKAFDFSIE
jgi:hypothetical protein